MGTIEFVVLLLSLLFIAAMGWGFVKGVWSLLADKEFLFPQTDLPQAETRPWQFSLFTLFVVTTLVACGTALVVWWRREPDSDARLVLSHALIWLLMAARGIEVLAGRLRLSVALRRSCRYWRRVFEAVVLAQIAFESIVLVSQVVLPILRRK